jgi:hypothetical protein
MNEYLASSQLACYRLGSIIAILAACLSVIQTTGIEHLPKLPLALTASTGSLFRVNLDVQPDPINQSDLPLATAAPSPELPLTIQPGRPVQALFNADSNSLVAKAVGNAEGTRRADGGFNRAYHGHVDPGNAVWNVGTFSYQHCRQCTPQEADRRQLTRLANQFAKIQDQAQRSGMKLSLEEQLNAIDLANQAPLAALSSGGFIDRLRHFKSQGLVGSQAILQARVYSYQNPLTHYWEAPGLGNTLSSITHDQSRRQVAIARAIQSH